MKFLNWEDEVKLENGIKNTIKWIDDNYEELSKHPWTYQHKS